MYASENGPIEETTLQIKADLDHALLILGVYALLSSFQNRNAKA